MSENPELREVVLKYLKDHNVAVLAVTSPESGSPWAAPVFFANDGLTLYFVSDPKTCHGAAVGSGTRIAAAVTEDHHDWKGIRGVQLAGHCQPVSGPLEFAKALKVYLAKYLFAADFLDPSGPMYAKAGAKVLFYRLDADEVWFTDNQQGFGHRERITP